MGRAKRFARSMRGIVMSSRARASGRKCSFIGLDHLQTMEITLR